MLKIGEKIVEKKGFGEIKLENILPLQPINIDFIRARIGVFQNLKPNSFKSLRSLNLQFPTGIGALWTYEENS